MSCDAYKPLLSGYVDSELTPEEVERAEKRIRAGQPVDRVCKVFGVGKAKLRKHIPQDRWQDMLAESKRRRAAL